MGVNILLAKMGMTEKGTDRMDGGVVAIKNFVLAVLNLRYTLAIQMEVFCSKLDK